MEPTKALQQVAMGRAIATFAFPADLGYFSLLCIIYCLLNTNDANRNRDKLDILFLFVSIFIGILSASKTFIYGTILLILYYSFYKRQRIIDILNIAVVITLVFYFGLLIYKHNEEFRTIVDWQLENAMNIERSYQLRYEGATKEMSIQIIKYFPYGKGILPINDVFVGDSGFLSYLFYGGVFSLSLFYIANVILMSKNKYLFALFLVAFFVELGRPAFFASRAADFFWLISGLFLRNDSSCAYK